MAPLNALTVDVEDWYHVCAVGEYLPPDKWDAYENRVNRNCERILDILRAHDTKVTFFVLGYIAERNPELVRMFHSEGHEIATHGFLHQRLFDQTPDEFRSDLEASVDAIRQAVSCDILGYRAPEWTVTRETGWAYDILIESGFHYDSSTVPLTMMGDRISPSVPLQGAHRPWVHLGVPCHGHAVPLGELPLHRRAPPAYVPLLVHRAGNPAAEPHGVSCHGVHASMGVRREPAPYPPSPRKEVHARVLDDVGAGEDRGLLERFRFGPIRDVLRLGSERP